MAASQFGYEIINGIAPLYRLAKQYPQRYPFLLESTAQSPSLTSSNSCYDILFAFPQASLIKHTDNRLTWGKESLPAESFLSKFDQLWQSSTHRTTLNDVPFSGGWFIFLSYEIASEVEPTLQLPQRHGQLPVAQATRIPAAIIVDRYRQQTILVTEPDYTAYLPQMRDDLASSDKTPSANSVGILPTNSIIEDDAQQYIDSVKHVLNYIQAGDVFQVNLSRAWQSTLKTTETAWDIYTQLRRRNPAPFAGVAQFGQAAIFSSSPERLVRVNNGQIETRPIAGTRPRAPTATDDSLMQQELIAHPKERAEHIMLIDLERNDLGRLCVPGTIQVSELMTLETYAHVHHIVSNISGKLRHHITPAEVIRSVFPGGTITGCPKVRCMEIIAELEKTARGAYTGSMGYINHNGNMDLNILIRTITQETNHITLRAGAGLVADSIPQHELDETRAKAKGMLLALTNEITHA